MMLIVHIFTHNKKCLYARISLALDERKKIVCTIVEIGFSFGSRHELKSKHFKIISHVFTP